jgi:hypothetical protein
VKTARARGFAGKEKTNGETDENPARSIERADRFAVFEVRSSASSALRIMMWPKTA